MNIKHIIEFIQNETPENQNLLFSAYKSVSHMLSEEQKLIDRRIPELISDRDYESANKYVEMSRIVSETFSNIDELAKECRLSMREEIEIKPAENNGLKNKFLEDEIESFYTNDKRINYENYRVDESVSYGLLTDFCHMKPAAFELDGVRYPARLWKLVLLKTCELLYDKNSSLFEAFVDDKFMQGKTREYFSINDSGMTKPERIKGTDIFVETNLSANSIRDVIVKMLDKYRIPHAAYQIYLSKDFNPLHTEENQYERSMDEDSVYEEKEVEKRQGSEILNMQDFCEDYDCKTGKCMNENSPYFIMECCKKKSCTYITRKSIYVFPKKVLKKKVCPYCSNIMERTIFQVEFEDNQEVKQRSLYGCWCKQCSQAYVTEGTYHSFVANKKLENIRATFVIDKYEQLSML